MWPFKKKCLCRYSDTPFVLIEEYRSGPWGSEVWHEENDIWPKIGLTRHIKSKWKCSQCGAIKVFDRRYIFNSRWGYAELLEHLPES